MNCTSFVHIYIVCVRVYNIHMCCRKRERERAQAESYNMHKQQHVSCKCVRACPRLISAFTPLAPSVDIRHKYRSTRAHARAHTHTYTCTYTHTPLHLYFATLFVFSVCLASQDCVSTQRFAPECLRMVHRRCKPLARRARGAIAKGDPTIGHGRQAQGKPKDRQSHSAARYPCSAVPHGLASSIAEVDAAPPHTSRRCLESQPMRRAQCYPQNAENTWRRQLATLAV